MWAGTERIRRIPADDAKELAQTLVAGLQATMQVSESEAEDFRRIVRRWADSLPSEAYHVAGTLPIEELHAAARATERLFREIERGLPPDVKRSEVIRLSTSVLLPFRAAEDREEKR